MVSLRPICESDLERIRLWVNQPEVYLNLAGRGRISSEEQKKWYGRYLLDDSKKIFAIELDGQHVGNASLFRIDYEHKRSACSIFIGEKGLRGRGTGRKAMNALFEFAFGPLQLNRVYLEVLVDNVSAIRCYENAGMSLEGKLRDHVIIDGQRRDMLLFSILKEEYKGQMSE